MDFALAKESGELCALTRTSDIVDAMVVAVARRYEADVATSDPHDIRVLMDAAGAPGRVEESDDGTMIEPPTETIDALQAALSSACSWHDVSVPLRQAAISADDPLYVFASAFDYRMPVLRRGDRRTTKSFEPMIELVTGDTEPPRLSSVPDAWLALWDRAAASDLSAPGRARFHDLLAERRWGDVVAHGRAAISAYIEVGQLERWSDLDRADALVRGLSLARRFNLDGAAQESASLILDAATRSLLHATPQPGVALTLLDALVQDSDTPAEVDGLLEKAWTTFPAVYLTESIIELQKSRHQGDPVAQRRLDAERVEAWLGEADRAEGLVRVVHLETAARLAGQHGLTDLEALARQRLQAIPARELELVSISEETTLPQEVVDEYLRPFTSATSTSDLLVALISHPPVTGHVDENRRALENARIEFPLQHMLPRVVLGGDRLPRWRATNERSETMAISRSTNYFGSRSSDGSSRWPLGRWTYPPPNDGRSPRVPAGVAERGRGPRNAPLACIRVLLEIGVDYCVVPGGPDRRGSVPPRSFWRYSTASIRRNVGIARASTPASQCS